MKNLDKTLTFPAVITIAAILCVSAIYPELSASMAGSAMKFVTKWFGWIVQIASLALVIFLFWLAFSDYGQIKLGEGDPEYSNLSYAGMIFTAGVGADLIYWGIGEPMYYLEHPPLFLKEMSFEAASFAVTYSIFHWGFTGWAIYCLPAIPFAYAFYVKKKTKLNLSTLCEPAVGKNKIVAFTIDTIAIFGTLAGIATGLSLSVSLMATGISDVFGFENNLMLKFCVLAFLIGTLMVLMLIGFSKGVARVSDTAIVVAFLFTSYILFVSDTSFILDNFTDSVGVMLDSYFRMSLYTDPVQKSGFPQDWTQFYWFWYYVFLIMMGLFITRISKGRTIKEVILYTINMGALGCACVIGVFGGYALWAELVAHYPVSEWIKEGGLTYAIEHLFSTFKHHKFVLCFLLVTQFFLVLTSISSASVSLAMLTTNRLELHGDPDNKIKLLWAVAVGAVTFSVYLTGGGIDTVKSLCVVTGLPMMFLYGILVRELVKDLKI